MRPCVVLDLCLVTTMSVSLEDSMLLMPSWDTPRTHSHTYSCVETEEGTVCFLPVPEVVRGTRLTATVIDLSPWVEYEFRVLASNSIGTGEPSKPSKQARTKGTCTYWICFKNWPGYISFTQLSELFREYLNIFWKYCSQNVHWCCRKGNH